MEQSRRPATTNRHNLEYVSSKHHARLEKRLDQAREVADAALKMINRMGKMGESDEESFKFIAEQIDAMYIRLEETMMEPMNAATEDKFTELIARYKDIREMLSQEARQMGDISTDMPEIEDLSPFDISEDEGKEILASITKNFEGLKEALSKNQNDARRKGLVCQIYNHETNYQTLMEKKYVPTNSPFSQEIKKALQGWRDYGIQKGCPAPANSEGSEFSDVRSEISEEPDREVHQNREDDLDQMFEDSMGEDANVLRDKYKPQFRQYAAEHLGENERRAWLTKTRTEHLEGNPHELKSVGEIRRPVLNKFAKELSHMQESEATSQISDPTHSSISEEEAQKSATVASLKNRTKKTSRFATPAGIPSN